MSSMAIAAVVYLGAALAIVQAAQGFGFAWRLLTVRRPTPDGPTPPVLVVLCLRGADPFLARCIDGLLQQDYPNYDVTLVIDHPDDEAWKQAGEIVAAHDAANVRIEALAERLASCSLKCSALLQGWQGAEERYAVVAGIDADVVPHSTWLRELVAPLTHADVAAATGNRWYMPDAASCGALTRYFWNAAAVVPMYWYGIAWGGSLAIKTDVLRDTDYRRRVSQALCEDTMLCDLIRGIGKRLAFVPSLMMVNRESCTLRDFYSWMRRQTLVAQLYHSRVIVITIHGLIVGAWLATAACVFVQAWIHGNAATVRLVGGVVGAFLGSMFGLLPLLEAGVRRIVCRRGEPTGWITPKKAVVAIVAAPVTLALYVAAVVSLLRVREIRWRGIRYRIEGPFQITRLDDGVYRAPAESAATHSL
jgi:cellulose synthase/poly-beta-1,6-N-acetylglucosamine synthase-like glycosyltransferase